MICVHRDVYTESSQTLTLWTQRCVHKDCVHPSDSVYRESVNAMSLCTQSLSMICVHRDLYISVYTESSLCTPCVHISLTNHHRLINLKRVLKDFR